LSSDDEEDLEAHEPQAVASNGGNGGAVKRKRGELAADVGAAADGEGGAAAKKGRVEPSSAGNDAADDDGDIVVLD
jgi:hypothetical protein